MTRTRHFCFCSFLRSFVWAQSKEAEKSPPGLLADMKGGIAAAIVVTFLKIARELSQKRKKETA